MACIAIQYATHGQYLHLAPSRAHSPIPSINTYTFHKDILTSLNINIHYFRFCDNFVSTHLYIYLPTYTIASNLNVIRKLLQILTFEVCIIIIIVNLHVLFSSLQWKQSSMELVFYRCWIVGWRGIQCVRSYLLKSKYSWLTIIRKWWFSAYFAHSSQTNEPMTIEGWDILLSRTCVARTNLIEKLFTPESYDVFEKSPTTLTAKA